MNEKNVNEMTIKEFRNLPWREDWASEFECDSLIVLPTEINRWDVIKYNIQNFLASRLSFIPEPKIYGIDGIHDSGYRCLDFVAVKDGKALCRLSGCSDVIHIDGIGGYGYRWFQRGKGVPKQINIHGWSIDCLAESGLLRIFSFGKGIICGEPFSSFEIFAGTERMQNETDKAS